MPAGRTKSALVGAMAWLAPVAGGSAQARSSAVPPPTWGINAPGIEYYASNVAFANLAIGSDWLNAKWAALEENYQDNAGNVLSLPAGGQAERFITIPPTGPDGIEVRCTYEGSGTLTLGGSGHMLSAAPGSMRFRVANQHLTTNPPHVVLQNVDSRRPFRNLDCRQAGLAPSVRFRPQFVDTLRGFGVIRFMDWQRANDNAAVTWANRHLPTGNRLTPDGVSIEDMLALTRELRADPWFVVPWNAGDDYIGGFARLVRAQLPPGRHVYIEVGNEVWNQGFPVGRQAAKEGLERKLGDTNEAGMRRYAQRTIEVMRLWEKEFAGYPGLVRVLATQQVNPQTARTALAFQDTAAHVDALATSAYFGGTYGDTGNTRDAIFARMTANLSDAIRSIDENRQIATSYGKRYVAYEGGEALVVPAQPDLLDRIQHDPAQYQLYRHFLAGWEQAAGDVMCQYVSIARPNTWGAWGLAAWEDETPVQAPKLRAFRDVMAGR